MYLLQNGKKVSKKKTSLKREEKNPIFNEAMIFSVPASALQVEQLYSLQHGHNGIHENIMLCWLTLHSILCNHCEIRLLLLVNFFGIISSHIIWSLVHIVGILSSRKVLTHLVGHFVNYMFIFQTVQLRLSVVECGSDGTKSSSIGHVIVGSQLSGTSLTHWNQMMSSLRKPIAMWHSLRK